MSLKEIPCILMRGGTSKGPYFLAQDLPESRDEIAKVLIAAMGAGSPLQVDGIGGSRPTTSKVAILSPSKDDWAEVDYLFAQVHAEKAEVDFSPSCGNMLAGVGPAAIEHGLKRVTESTTSVRIHNVNTGALIEAQVETPDGEVNYSGDARIDGVPGTAAPIILNFKNVIGSKTGKLFPTGNPKDLIGGFEVTCIDVAMPMVIGLAEDFGITGHETRETIDENKALFERFEKVRMEAGKLMGFGDVSHSVVPKFGLLAKAAKDGTIAARYFMPWSCHPAYAVTGAICTGSCVLAGNTVADTLIDTLDTSPTPVRIEHPTGSIDVMFEHSHDNGEFQLHSAGLLRTARRLFSGKVSIPAS